MQVYNFFVYGPKFSGLTHLFNAPDGRGSVAYTVFVSFRLVTPECTRGVIDPLCHSRHKGRDR